MDEKKAIQSFLDNYKLTLRHHESLGKIKKVYTDNGVFCIKTISAYKNENFIKDMQSIYQKGFNRIVPIFMTKDQKYGDVINGEFWYLMPWIPNDKYVDSSERNRQMFRELAKLHTLTIAEKKITEHEFEGFYDRMMDRLEKQQDLLDEFIAQCERKEYASPFELQFCTYYYDISQALDFSIKKFEQWYKIISEKKKVRTVAIHGKFSPEHFLFSDSGYGYFVNMEKTQEAGVHFDLILYIVKKLRDYPVKSDDMLSDLNHYNSYFPWFKEEIMLFESYLSHPERCIKIIEDYVNSTDKNEAKMCGSFQKEYWQLKNIEYVIMKIEEEEARKAFEMENQSEVVSE